MWVFLVLLFSPRTSAVAPPPVQLSCKNQNGLNVDWFVMYKAPALINVRTGLDYIYIDAGGKTVMTPTSRPYKPINDGDGVLAHTLRPMLSSVRNMPPSFGFLSYSDQPPGANAKMDFGHSKGVVLGDSVTNTALWLSHSTPQFPFRRDQNRFWPDSGAEQGQTFICLSLTFTALMTVGDHLKNIRAYPFDYDLPSNFPNSLQQAARWDHSDDLQGLFQTLWTRGNKELKTMAKVADYEARASVGDLYVRLAAGLDSDLSAQTWGCQPKRDESFCDTNARHVMNVEEITTELGSWSTKRDHSKWAVTKEANTDWTCFGDVNRAPSQYERWGGAVCIKDRQTNRFMKSYTIKELQCRKRPAPCDSDIALGK